MDDATATRLADIRDKVHAGAASPLDDGLFLDREADLFALGELANVVRERKKERHVLQRQPAPEPTNVCVYRCAFCSFRADLKSPPATS
jgi:aminodeoxyfutalosine synthase